MPASRRSRDKQHVRGNLYTLFATYPVSVGAAIVVANVLGAELKGALTYFILVRGAFLPIATVGLGTAARYWLASGRCTPQQLTWSIIGFGLTVGAAIGLAAYAAIDLGVVGEIAEALPRTLTAIVCAQIPLFAVGYLLKDVFVGDDRFAYFNRIQLASTVLFAAASVGLVAVFDLGLGGAVAAMSLETVCYAGLSLFLAWRSGYLRRDRARQPLRPLLAYGIRSVGGTLSSQVNDRLDAFVVGYYLSPAALGVYAIAYSLAKLVTVLPTAVSPVLMNKVSRTGTAGDGEPGQAGAALRVLGDVARPLLLVTLLLVPLLVGVAYFAIPVLYGSDFAGAFVPLTVLLLGIVPFATTRRMIDKYFNGTERPLNPTLVQTVGSVVSIGLCFALIPRLGILGAAVASTAAWLSGTLFGLYLLRGDTARPFALAFRFTSRDTDMIRAGLRTLLGPLRARLS